MKLAACDQKQDGVVIKFQAFPASIAGSSSLISLATFSCTSHMPQFIISNPFNVHSRKRHQLNQAKVNPLRYRSNYLKTTLHNITIHHCSLGFLETDWQLSAPAQFPNSSWPLGNLELAWPPSLMWSQGIILTRALRRQRASR